MSLSRLKLVIIKGLKKITEKLYNAGVFEIMSGNRKQLQNPRISIGEYCHIDSTVRMIMSQGGTVELKGSNNIGKNTEITPIDGGSVSIGYGSSIQSNNYLVGDVEIGKFCLTAPNVFISSGTHYFDLNPYLYIKDQDSMVRESKELSAQHSKKVIIDDDVWIGINVAIMRGVKIGRGSIIGSNSVVSKDVEPFSIMGGAPAKLIKKRLDFLPKNKLHFENEKDLPNFYKGFYLDAKSLLKDRNLGGISTSSKFQLYLESVGDKISLRVKKLTSTKVKLTYFDQEKEIDQNDFVEIEFRLNKVNYHEFTAVYEGVSEQFKYLCVQSIKIH